ncbi:MAG: hypothetical protein HZC37_11555 [Burkholderiales bacterium]|nr:hypothetical protein [Burkholderiales bacterium]
MTNPAPATSPRRTTSPRRLPRWLRRSVRAWTRCARWWAGGSPRARRTGTALYAIVVPDSEAEASPHERRCGWFDSSQDLREGLCISEHDGSDAVCAQLPVMAWVQLQLSGWRPSLSGAQPELAR